MAHDVIRIKGARQNNLRNLDIDLPLGELVVVTGVSGSGKSSLAFDTVYSEGQRRYVETFSPYARQFLDRMDKPAVDAIEGIPPSIAIDQNNPVRTSRSTVGTMTELNDHLKLLFARTAQLYCGGCGQRVQKDDPESIAARLLARAEGQRAMVVATVAVPKGLTAKELKGLLESQGYTRFHKTLKNRVEVVVDRVRLAGDRRDRLVEALEAGLHLGRGNVAVHPLDDDRKPLDPWRFSADFHCADCDIHYQAPSSSLFSFNSPVGACETCRGFGRVMGIDYSLVIPDENKTLADGCIRPFQSGRSAESQTDLMRYARRAGIATDIPWKDLPQDHRDWVIEGEGGWNQRCWYGVRRYFDWVERKSYKMHMRVLLSRYRSYDRCPDCDGARLKPEPLLWRVGGHDEVDRVVARDHRYRPHGAQLDQERFLGLPGLNLQDMMNLPLGRLRDYFEHVELPAPLDEAAELLLDGIRARLRYLTQVGLGYLTLDRQSRTLSGGEVQRINLTTALGTSLVNTLFVLDEPSIGLHPRDMGRIIEVMHRLRDAGNSLLVVEHDPDVMHAANRILDIGPGPGERGGEIVCFDTPDKVAGTEGSLTGDYLAGRRSVAAARPDVRREPADHWLRLRGATEHNLQGLDADIPLERLVCVTGVSGSGKSTLVTDVLYNTLARRKGHGTNPAGHVDALEGDEHLDDVVLVDQSPIGKTTRSNPASYVGAFEAIRKAYAAEAFVDAVSEEYADATHNVPAYRVRVGGSGSDLGTNAGAGVETDDVNASTDSGFLREYSSDDGEPSGSAGKPALNVLAQQEIENCAVVVTRYYGGTNLGVGGLVRAYSRAVKEAVAEAGIVEERPHETVSIGVEYDDSGTVRSILESEDYEFDAEYQASVSFEVRVPLAEANAFRDRLRSATSGRVDLE